MTNDTLIFDGTDIKTLAGLTVVDFAPLFSQNVRRGSHDVQGGVDGQRGNQLPFDAYAFTIPISVNGATRAQVVSRMTAIGAALAGTDGLGTMVRHLDNGTTYTSSTADGAFAGFGNFTSLGFNEVATDLQFWNLSGGWYASGVRLAI